MISNRRKPHNPETTEEPETPSPAMLPAQAGASPAARVTLRAGADGPAVTETVWAQIGGEATFERITRAFYDGVKADPDLAPMYPDADWEGAIWRLQKFLEQYWGGPTTYSEHRGHPRLRMRHQPFRVTPHARDRWLHHMHSALDVAELPPMHDAAIRDYVERAAYAMVNSFDEAGNR